MSVLMPPEPSAERMKATVPFDTPAGGAANLYATIDHAATGESQIWLDAEEIGALGSDHHAARLATELHESVAVEAGGAGVEAVRPIRGEIAGLIKGLISEIDADSAAI